MNNYKHTIEQFFFLYKTSKNRIEIYIYKDWACLSFSKFCKLPQNVSFMYCGSEFMKLSDNTIVRLNG